MGHIYRGRGTFGPAMTFEYLAAPHLGRKGQSMPIDLDEALGAELPPAESFWTSSDIQLYHLGLDEGSEPVNERNCATSPTTPRRCCRRSETSHTELPHDKPATGAVSRYRLRAFMVLHASEAVSAPGPIPPSPQSSQEPRQYSDQTSLPSGAGDESVRLFVLTEHHIDTPNTADPGQLPPGVSSYPQILTVNAPVAHPECLSGLPRPSRRRRSIARYQSTVLPAAIACC